MCKDAQTQGEVQSSFTENPPERVSLSYLLQEAFEVRRPDFEEWADSLWLNTTINYQRARLRLSALRRLGVSPAALRVEQERLARWKKQVAECQTLAPANQYDPELDYSDPITLKYLALWFWSDRATNLLEDEFTSGPLNWAKYLDEDLLNLHGIGCR